MMLKSLVSLQVMMFKYLASIRDQCLSSMCKENKELGVRVPDYLMVVESEVLACSARLTQEDSLV